MERLVWQKPEMQENVFEANDSVSACIYTVCTLPLPGGDHKVNEPWLLGCPHHDFVKEGHYYYGGDNAWDPDSHWSCMCGSGIGYDPDTKESANSWFTSSEITGIKVDTTPNDSVDNYVDAFNWSQTDWAEAFKGITGALKATWTTVTEFFGGIDTATQTHEGFVTYDGESANHS